MDEKKKTTGKKTAVAGKKASGNKTPAAKASKPAEVKAELPVKAAPVRKAGKRSPEVVATAVLRHIRISPRKARLVVDLIKGQQVDSALRILRYSPKKAAGLTAGVLRSAIANAKERAGVDVDSLWVVGGKVDMGRTLKRWTTAAHGRATPVMKRSAHITLYLGALN